VRPEGLRKFEKIHLVGTLSRDLPACSIAPKPLRYRVPLVEILVGKLVRESACLVGKQKYIRIN
jgi:hypothetical protein